MQLSKEDQTKLEVMLAKQVKVWQRVAKEVVLCWQCQSVASGSQVRMVQGYEFCCEECSQKFFSSKAVA